MILHIFNDNHKVFYAPFIKFINKYFSEYNNFFAIIGSNADFLPENAKLYNGYRDNDFLDKVNKAQKVIVHSLFRPQYVIYLFFHKKLMTKHIWVAWGGDVHFFELRNQSVKYFCYEIIRRHVIPKFYKICTLVKDDYKLIQQCYGVKNNNLPVVYVNEELNNFVQSLKEIKDFHEEIRIIVGNSATSSNNHEDAFKFLEQFRNENIKVYCPLSYGDMAYAEKIQEIGKEKFGTKFIAVADYMDQNKYFELLNSMDIGIYNNTMQQSLGNVYVMLELKKKVFLSKDSDMWNGVTSNTGAKVYGVQDIENMDFNEFISRDENVLEQNERLMYDYNSADYAKKVWKDILES